MTDAKTDAPDMKREATEVSSLLLGEARLVYPIPLSMNDVEEIEEWFALLITKLKRRYAAERGPQSAGE